MAWLVIRPGARDDVAGDRQRPPPGPRKKPAFGRSTKVNTPFEENYDADGDDPTPRRKRRAKSAMTPTPQPKTPKTSSRRSSPSRSSRWPALSGQTYTSAQPMRRRNRTGGAFTDAARLFCV